jgi:predicted Co/Zn/Cd cation transporter (cation efflux family)
MKKIFSLIFATLLVLSLVPTTLVSAASDDNEFRVGMEAGYPPFNWTQKHKPMVLSRLTVVTNMLTAMMFKSLRKLPKS